MTSSQKRIVLVDDMTTNHLIFKSHIKNCNYQIDAFKEPHQFLKEL